MSVATGAREDRFLELGFTAEQARALAAAGYDVWFVREDRLLGGTL